MAAAYWCIPLKDNEFISKLGKFRAKFTDMTFHVQLGFGAISFSNSEGEVYNKLKSSNGYSINHFTLGYGNQTFSYQRNHGQLTSMARLEVIENGSVNAFNDQLDFGLLVLKELGNPSLGNSPPPENIDFASSFSKIESAMSGAVAQFSALQAEFQLKNQELREQHEQEVHNLVDGLEKQKILLDLEHSRKVAKFSDEMEAERNKIKEQKKELDERSNTTVRRAIRREIKEGIQTSLNENVFSKGTMSQRIIVRIAYFLIIGFAAWYAYDSSVKLDEVIRSNVGGIGWLVGAKASIATLSTIGLSLLYIRLEVGWNQQQANFEKMLSSTRVDIDRASWIMESLLEWNRDSERPIPDELLSSLTRRLFDWDAQVETHQSNADSLASAILGAAANVRLGPNGAEVDLNNKGIGKLSKS